MDHTNQVLLWSTFIFVIIILAGMGASSWVKGREGLVIRPPATLVSPPNAGKMTDIVSDNNVNVYFPGTIWITFNDLEQRKKGGNSDIYQHADYNNWSTPQHATDNHTTNMFTAQPDPRFVGSVNSQDPFATTAPPPVMLPNLDLPLWIPPSHKKMSLYI